MTIGESRPRGEISVAVTPIVTTHILIRGRTSRVLSLVGFALFEGRLVVDSNTGIAEKAGLKLGAGSEIERPIDLPKMPLNCIFGKKQAFREFAIARSANNAHNDLALLRGQSPMLRRFEPRVGTVG